MQQLSANQKQKPVHVSEKARLCLLTGQTAGQRLPALLALVATATAGTQGETRAAQDHEEDARSQRHCRSPKQ